MILQTTLSVACQRFLMIGMVVESASFMCLPLAFTAGPQLVVNTVNM